MALHTHESRRRTLRSHARIIARTSPASTPADSVGEAVGADHGPSSETEGEVLQYKFCTEAVLEIRDRSATDGKVVCARARVYDGVCAYVCGVSMVSMFPLFFLC